jgi:hypothetical protein
MIPTAFTSPATPFVGREHELAEIGNLLADPACQLLTLVGPGGIGKTRLAIEAANQSIPTSNFSPSQWEGKALGGNDTSRQFPDGVRFVPLQPLAAPDLIVSASAEALGIQFSAKLNPNSNFSTT